MLARRGRTRPRLLLSVAYAGYSGRDLTLTWTAASGPEDAFPRQRLSARCRLSQGTFAGTRGNGRDAPTPDLHAAAPEKGSSTPSRPDSGSTPPDFCGLVELLRNVAKLALPLRAEAAESGFLHPVCDSSYQQFAAEMRGCIGFVERAPALTKLAEIELGEARERLPASRCILDRAAHACCGAAMR